MSDNTNSTFYFVEKFVKDSFENPINTYKAFYCTNKDFLRFSVALSKTQQTDNPNFGILYETGADGALFACENLNSLIDIIIELTGITGDSYIKDSKIELSSLEILVLLGACDVILQNKFENGWFTASSVYNSFSVSPNDNFNRLIFSLAYVANEEIYASISFNDILNVIDSMVKTEIFEIDTIDELNLYTFSPEYRYLLDIFSNVTSSFSICSLDQSANTSIIFSITNTHSTWLIKLKSNYGSIENVNIPKLISIARDFLMPASHDFDKLDKPTSKFCEACGNSVKSEAKFCPLCGAPFL